MAGIQKSINKGGFDLGYWSILDGHFNASTKRMVINLGGWKDKNAYELNQSHYKGGEIKKILKWAEYDGSNLVYWIYTKCLEPEIKEENGPDLNIFKDGVIDLT